MQKECRSRCITHAAVWTLQRTAGGRKDGDKSLISWLFSFQIGIKLVLRNAFTMLGDPHNSLSRDTAYSLQDPHSMKRTQAQGPAWGRPSG